MIKQTPTHIDDYLDILDSTLVHYRKDILDKLVHCGRLESKVAGGKGSMAEECGARTDGARRLSSQICNVLGFLCVEKNNTGLRDDLMTFEVKSEKNVFLM